MSATTYSVRVDARRDTVLSRWLWLVKWFLAIPHYFALAFLWLAFVVLSAVAFVAILFTGRYPRSIFEFNVGVLRWTWRVQYYSYGALGTDRYPPFSLQEAPGFPAHLEVDYPRRLSRGLVLVKWWLLAIPQYIIVGLLIGGGTATARHVGAAGFRWPAGWPADGLIGLLVLVAAIILAVTGRYPDALFDFILGLNRWVLRVAAYAGLMTDEYPPFRLDLGGTDPGTLALGVVAASPDAAVLVPGAAVRDRPPGDYRDGQGAPVPGGPAPGQPAPGGQNWPAGPGWTALRVVAIVVGSVLALAGAGLCAGAAGLSWAGHAYRQAGYVTTGAATYTTRGYTLATDTIRLPDAGHDWFDALVGRVRLRVTGSDPSRPVFIGVARAAQVSKYLSGVSYTTLTNIGGGVTRVEHAGAVVPVPPSAEPIWVVRASGVGRQALIWTPRAGNWVVVAMNQGATPGVTIRADVGATVPALSWLVAGMLAAGLLLVAGAVALIVVSARRASATTPVVQGSNDLPVA